MIAAPAAESVEYTISAESLGWFADRFAKIERRAARAGLAGSISWSEVSRQRREREDGLGSDTFVTIRVSGDSPRYGGWTLAATLAHAGEAGTIIRSVPSFDGKIHVAYRDATSETCDHCHSRRARLDTFLVANEETGEWKQVGRNCIANFLGLGDPHALVALADIWGNLVLDLEGREEQDRTGGMLIPEQINLDAALEYAAESVIRSGWLSRGKAREIGGLATADLALAAMFPGRGGNACRQPCRQPCPEHFTPSEQAVQMAAAALEWAPEWLAEEQARADRDGTDVSDYVHNMRVVLGGSTVTRRSFALGASLLAVWRRHQERQERERQERENAVPSAWVGAVGERITLTLTVQATREFASDFGTRTLITYHDQDGNVVKWWATGFHDPAEGTVETVDATVAKHEEYRGRKETVVSRVKPHVSKDAKKALAAARKAKRAEIAAAQAILDAAEADAKAVEAAAVHFENDDEWQGLQAAYLAADEECRPVLGEDRTEQIAEAPLVREALYLAMNERREAVGARWGQPEVLEAKARVRASRKVVDALERELYDLR